MSLLEMLHVRKAFGSHVVLRDFSLSVDQGECVCLIGPSGSGKSTALRCINLLEQIDDGVIRLDGTELTDPRVDPDVVRSQIGIVFQSYNLFPHLSVLRNITLAPLKVHKMEAAEAEARAVAILDRVGDRKSTRLNSSHRALSRMPSSA